MWPVLDHGSLHDGAPFETVAGAAGPRRPTGGTPPLSSICEEIARKHLNVRRLLANVQRDEGKARSMQVRLATLLKEKSRREQEVQTAFSNLPTLHAITDLKLRLQAACESKQDSANKINDVDAYFTLIAANAKMKCDGKARQEHEYMGLKRSIRVLQGEVANLKLQLHELSSNVKRNAVCRDPPYSNEKMKNSNKCLSASAGIDKMKREKRMWEERVREAAATWRMAITREAKVTRIFESLKRRMASLSPPSVSPTRTIKPRKRFNPVAEDVVAEAFIPPLESGSLLAVSLSRQAEEPATEACSCSQAKCSFFWTPLKKCSGREKNKLFLPMNDGKGNMYSKEETLKRQVEDLEVEYARVKCRVSKLREENNCS
ncbi:hypothetical protein TraAM80_07118 [Trypanosoma rangeli]|uniref:Uncharacterized protein n=1 Tax=Trypanosoma rangeli TaxID=5698 RepID=A0A422N735_TRYRA|nr:uncharacterized protein TraAM80_07118 [Trypanosoma rangeli]RNF01265.1 hypothetical protein TraAM80_07118 [Trypanosoma rangeli]|eukprot:RNF01265.1 hypothetical protein TraAM80_07118 [Trypanosoma rangeli]